MGIESATRSFQPYRPSSSEWEDRTAKREKLGNLLELQVGPLGGFKTGVAILTPLVGSLIGLLLQEPVLCRART